MTCIYRVMVAISFVLTRQERATYVSEVIDTNCDSVFQCARVYTILYLYVHGYCTREKLMNRIKPDLRFDTSVLLFRFRRRAMVPVPFMRRCGRRQWAALTLRVLRGRFARRDKTFAQDKHDRDNVTRRCALRGEADCRYRRCSYCKDRARSAADVRVRAW